MISLEFIFFIISSIHFQISVQNSRVGINSHKKIISRFLGGEIWELNKSNLNFSKMELMSSGSNDI